MRWIVVAGITLFVACAIEHHVKLLLGPNEQTISTGFGCQLPSGDTIFKQAISSGKYNFNVVVDVIDLGGTFPSCLGEDVQAACNDGTAEGACTLTTSVASQRICFPVSVLATGDPRQAIKDDLEAHHSMLIDDAPDRPVILRVVATTEDCGAVQKLKSTGDRWVSLTSNTTDSIVLGCAYSCPIVLDNAGTTVSIGIGLGLPDLDTSICIPTIDTCAAFPAKP